MKPYALNITIEPAIKKKTFCALLSAISLIFNVFHTRNTVAIWNNTVIKRTLKFFATMDVPGTRTSLMKVIKAIIGG